MVGVFLVLDAHLAEQEALLVAGRRWRMEGEGDIYIHVISHTQVEIEFM